jgi:signal transduction histidine kinase
MAKITIKDNGKGFDTNSLKESGGLGLRLLQERVDMLGGTITIKSTLDKGTEVALQFPVADLPVNK